MQNEMLNVPRAQRMRSPLASTMNLNLEDDLLSAQNNDDALQPLENQPFATDFYRSGVADRD